MAKRKRPGRPRLGGTVVKARLGDDQISALDLLVAQRRRSRSDLIAEAVDLLLRAA